jgi:acyl carrier protein
MIERITYCMSEAPTNDELAAHVMRVIAATHHIPVESISIDSTFEQLKIDSLDGINIVFALESEFKISVPDDAMQNLRSIQDTVNGVRDLLAKKDEAGSPA